MLGARSVRGPYSGASVLDDQPGATVQPLPDDAAAGTVANPLDRAALIVGVNQRTALLPCRDRAAALIKPLPYAT